RSYMDADPLYPPDHYLHNQQFLIYVLGALGRYRDAIDESRKLLAVPENERERNALEGSSFYRTGWFSLMRTLVRFEKWDEILDGATLPFYNKPREASWYHWARSLASAAKGNRADAVEALPNMDAMLDSARGSRRHRVRRSCGVREGARVGGGHVVYRSADLSPAVSGIRGQTRTAQSRFHNRGDSLPETVGPRARKRPRVVGTRRSIGRRRKDT
ncbi:MAG: hypothetical protein DMG11_24640, partial [Acidobacteria bacterium]